MHTLAASAATWVSKGDGLVYNGAGFPGPKSTSFKDPNTGKTVILYSNGDGTNCQDRIEFPAGSADNGQKATKATYLHIITPQTCTYQSPQTISVTPFKDGTVTVPGDDGSGGTDPTPPTDGSDGESANCTNGANALAWVMCPVYDSLAGASDWILKNIISPFLRTSPVSTDPSDPSYKIWSMFRVYGDIFLVIALLVVVFGQSIGGGLVDAYTAKKVLPRLLIAAILINLSIYIVAFLVDVTNVIGGSIGAAMTAPLHNQGLFSISPSGVGLGKIAGVTGTAIITAWAAGALGAVFSLSFGAFLGLFVILPAILALLVIFVTLALRKAIILALILVAPVAFALYCLPNTEQYFRKWWDLLVKTLMIYPIVMILFAVCDILAVTVVGANNSGSALALMISFLLQFLPLLLIPYAFRLSGSALASIHDAVTEHRKRGQEAIKGNPNDQNSLRNRVRYNARSSYIASRGKRYDQLSNFSKSGSGWRRQLGGRAAKLANFGNLELQRARMNKDQDELIASQYATGGDNTIRAYWARQYSGPTEYVRDSEGNVVKDENGNDRVAREAGRWYTYKQPDGSYKEWSAGDVRTARGIVGNDPSRVQSFAKYEISKAAHDGNLADFMTTFADDADRVGWNETQANEVWAGVKFAHQQSRKELKYTSMAKDPNTGKFTYKAVDHHGLSNELVDTMRKGDFASFRSSTGKAALAGFQEAKSKVDAGTATQQDREIYDNYQALADHLNTSLFGIGANSEQARLAAAQAAQAAAGEGETADATGYGLGASARAEAAWRDFVTAARSGPSAGSGGGGSAPSSGSGGGGGIIIPPRGYTGGQG